MKVKTLAVSIVLLAAVFLFARSIVAQSGRSGSPTDDRLTALEARVDALERRVAAMESTSGRSTNEPAPANRRISTDRTNQPADAPVISWKDARKYVDKVATVEGEVKGAHFAEKQRRQPTFINVGDTFPAPERFTVVIWGDDRANFPEPPEKLYAGKTIRVTGTISIFQEVPQISVKTPDEIEIVK